MLRGGVLESTEARVPAPRLTLCVCPISNFLNPCLREFPEPLQKPRSPRMGSQEPHIWRQKDHE